MQTVSSQFLEATAAPGFTTYARVTIGSTVLGPDAIQSIDVEVIATEDGTFGVGNTASMTASLVLLTSALPLVYVANDIKVELGYMMADGTPDLVTIGIFGTNDSMVYDSGLFTTIEAHDAFFWMDEEDSHTWARGTEVSTRTMMNDMLKDTSVKYDINELPDVRLRRFRPTGTKRERIGQVCAAAMVNAMFDGQGRLRFRKPTATGMLFEMSPSSGNTSPIAELLVSSDYMLPVNRVKAELIKTYPMVTSSSGDYTQAEDEVVVASYPAGADGLAVTFGAESLSADGSFLYKSASDDGGLAQARDDLSRMASSAVSGKRLPQALRGFDMTLYGYPQMEPFDTFTVKNLRGMPYTLTPTGMSWHYDGTIQTTFSAVASSADTETPTLGSASTIASIAEAVNGVRSKNMALTSLTVQTLKGDNATFNSVMVTKLLASELVADKIETEALNAVQANIGTITSNVIDAVTGQFDDLLAKSAIIEDLQADTAKIKDLDVVSLTVDDAAVGSLLADNIMANTLTALIGTFNTLDANYLHADFSNIDTAHIENLYVAQGMMDNVIIKRAEVTGDLVAVTFKGDVVEAGTLKGDRLLLKGEDGLYYQMNVNELGQAGVTQLPQEMQDQIADRLHGEVIMAKSITAEKITVADLEAFDATIGGFTIDQSSVHSTGKAFGDGKTGTYLGAGGHFEIGSDLEYVRFNPETGRLEISVQALSIGAMDLAGVIDDLSGRVTANSTLITQTSNEVNIGFTQIGDKLAETDDAWNELYRYIRFVGGDMELGEGNSDFKTVLTNQELAFKQGDVKVAYINNNTMHITRAEITDEMTINNWVWKQRASGNISFKWRASKE